MARMLSGRKFSFKVKVLISIATLCTVLVSTSIRISIPTPRYCMETLKQSTIDWKLQSLFSLASSYLLRGDRGHTCIKNYFQNILLIVNFNEPFYENIDLIKYLYGDVFSNIAFYGTNESTIYDINKVDTRKGYFSYIDIAHAMEYYANYTGYLLINDDVLLNPWNLMRLDQNKIWEGPKWPVTIGNFSKFDNWYWWKSRWGLENCKATLNELEGFYQNLNINPEDIIFMRHLYRNARNHSNYNCHRGRSDVVYIPKTFSKEYMELAEIFRRHKVFLEIAFPTLLRMLQSSEQFERLDGVYLPGRVKTAPVTNSSYLWSRYNEQLDFIHPVKLHYRMNSQTNRVILTSFFKRFVDRFTSCST